MVMSGPFTFVFARNVIGGLVLLPVIAVLGKVAARIRSKKAPEAPQSPAKRSLSSAVCAAAQRCARAASRSGFARCCTPVGRPDSSPRATS